MKKLKFVWKIFKMLFLIIFGLNFVPAIFMGITYLRGNPHHVGYIVPYATGLSIMAILMVIYCIHDIMKPTYKL